MSNGGRAGGGTSEWAENLMVCWFCLIEIILDAILFFSFIAITVLLHKALHWLIAYFQPEKNDVLQWLVNGGTIFLMGCEALIVLFFACRSVKNAYLQTWGK